MFPEVWTDILAVIGMFLLRVGIPIALTIALGKWLEKKLAPRAEKKASSRSSNIIQLHCWDFKKCDSALRAKCAAYQHPDLPCWLAIQAEGGKVRPECFSCALYKPQTLAA